MAERFRDLHQAAPVLTRDGKRLVHKPQRRGVPEGETKGGRVPEGRDEVGCVGVFIEILLIFVFHSGILLP